MLEGRKMQQICYAAKIYKNSVHVKIVNTQNKYKCIIMRGDDPGRLYRRKGYGAVNRLNYCVAPQVLTVFIQALAEAARNILLICRLDWYWSSVGPPNMKLMVGRGSDGCSAPTIVLSATEAVSIP